MGTSSANQNFVDAQYQLGLLHMDGSKDNEILPINEQGVIVTTPMTVPINKELGFQWLSTAAKQGHAVAQYEVGMSYRMGERRTFRGIDSRTMVQGSSCWFSVFGIT